MFRKDTVVLEYLVFFFFFFFFLKSILAYRIKAYGEVMGKALIRPKTSLHGEA